jgi:hypothetical protein
MDCTIDRLCLFLYVVAVFARNEAAAYHLSELIEDHAYRTYDKVSDSERIWE